MSRDKACASGSVSQNAGACQGARFEIAISALKLHGILRLRVFGASMLPALWPGDCVVIHPVGTQDIEPGTIVLAHSGGRFVLHRVVEVDLSGLNTLVHTRGDSRSQCDEPIQACNVLGELHAVIRGGRRITLPVGAGWTERLCRTFLRNLSPLRRIAVAVHSRWRGVRPLGIVW